MTQLTLTILSPHPPSMAALSKRAESCSPGLPAVAPLTFSFFNHSFLGILQLVNEKRPTV